MEKPKVQEIFNIMGTLENHFKEQIKKEGEFPSKYFDRVCSENFVGEFKQFGASGGRLIQGQNIQTAGGTASITPDIRFKVAIRPVDISNAPTLRLEVDSEHRSGKNRVIHVKSADGCYEPIPEDIIKEVSPMYPVDLVAISGSQPFRTAVNKSINYWEKMSDYE